MNVLALDVDNTTLWQVLLVVVVVVVLGVVALITTLLFIVRSITASIRQLREMAAEQVAAAQTGVTSPPSAGEPGAARVQAETREGGPPAAATGKDAAGHGTEDSADAGSVGG